MADSSMRVTINMTSFEDDPVDIDVSFTVPDNAQNDKALRSDLIGIAGQAAHELYTRAYFQPKAEAKAYGDIAKSVNVTTDLTGRR